MHFILHDLKTYDTKKHLNKAFERVILSNVSQILTEDVQVTRHAMR